jgi:hypothetical protein
MYHTTSEESQKYFIVDPVEGGIQGEQDISKLKNAVALML